MTGEYEEQNSLRTDMKGQFCTLPSSPNLEKYRR